MKRSHFPTYALCTDGLLRRRVEFDGLNLSHEKRDRGVPAVRRVVRFADGRFLREEKVQDHSCPKCVRKRKLN